MIIMLLRGISGGTSDESACLSLEASASPRVPGKAGEKRLQGFLLTSTPVTRHIHTHNSNFLKIHRF